MTTILYYKEYEGLDGMTWFVEKYQDKYQMIPWWRYGYINKKGVGIIKSHTLWTKPNLKKLHLIK